MLAEIRDCQNLTEQLRRLARSGHLDPERLLAITARIDCHLANLADRELGEPVAVRAAAIPADALQRALDHTERLEGLPLTRARFVGHLTIIEGGRQ